MPISFFHLSVPPLHLALLLFTALAAGAINSVAGGGTLLTFPVLLSVLGNSPNGSVIANGTSTVALVPGSLSAFWGYRSEVAGQKRSLWEMAVPSLLGGAVGAYLATHVSAAIFSHLVPWLIFGATFLFLIQDPVRRWIGRGAPTDDNAEPRHLGIGGMIFQFFVAVYGGFFGAGIGILMLAALGFLGQTNIYRMNGLKNFAAVCINGVGALTFIFYRRVDWTLALLMMVMAVAGGYGGAGLAKRVGQANVRRFVIAIGLIFGAYTLYGQLHHG
ncbi:MAG: sulfite exporter TauE/SafE family protein [Janthinobacterium lividum]